MLMGLITWDREALVINRLQFSMLMFCIMERSTFEREIESLYGTENDLIISKLLSDW
jgi:hypothetical protein